MTTEVTGATSKTVSGWLLVCCVLIFAMIVLGGVTRLTHSGLSMVDWDPVMGIVPPLSHEDWQSTFERYRQFPEYQKVNRGMSLAEFKEIYYVEYAHRVLGRLIGVVFIVPLVVFIAMGRISRSMVPRFAAMFVLGGLQGVLGWVMVQSGLVDRPSVSQYRLTAHLLLAVLIYGFILWTALGLWRGTNRRTDAPGSLHRFGWVVVVVVGVMIASGGFVAGTRAGFIYNTFPMMAGAWIPDGLWSLQPGWRNLFENVVTIQFVHRWLAIAVAIVVAIYGVVSLRRSASVLTAWLMLAALAAQVSMGIAALVYKVPVVLGASHQAGAVLLVTLVLVHTHHLKYVPDPAPFRRRSAAGEGSGVIDGRPEPL